MRRSGASTSRSIRPASRTFFLRMHRTGYKSVGCAGSEPGESRERSARLSSCLGAVSGRATGFSRRKRQDSGQACPFEQPEVPAIYQCVTHARSARIQRRSNRPVQCAKVVVPARLREVVRLQDHPRPVRQSGNVKQRLREERVLAQMIVVDPPDCAVAAKALQEDPPPGAVLFASRETGRTGVQARSRSPACKVIWAPGIDGPFSGSLPATILIRETREECLRSASAPSLMTEVTPPGMRW